MADMGHMHPDLMGPAGLQAALQKACNGLTCNSFPCGGVVSGDFATERLAANPFAALPAIAFQHQPLRHRLTAPLAHRHLVARMGMAVDWPVDRAARLVGCAPDNGQI